MVTIITSQDVRFKYLNKARNARYPVTPAEGPGAIAVCQHKQDIADALQDAVSKGTRPTVRAGGHCYEDFYIANPDGLILDLAQLDYVGTLPGDPRIHIGPGAQMGKVYLDLYRAFNTTLPGASCTTVTAGGHIAGGGFGVYSRMFGVTTDWVTEVEILTVDGKGKVIPRTVNAKRDPDLFRAVLGAGGGNYGIITDYIFDKLPPAPQEVVSTGVNWAWDDLDEEKFGKIMRIWGHFMETRGQDPDMWGLFTGIGLGHRSVGGRFGIGAQFCNLDGTTKDLKPLQEFLALFDDCNGEMGAITKTHAGETPAGPALSPAATRGAKAFMENCAGCHGNDAHGGSIGPNLASAQNVIALSDDDIKRIVHNGFNGKMPGFSQLKDAQVADIVSYLRAVQAQSNPAGGQGNGRRRNGGNGDGNNNNAPAETISTPCGPHNLSRSQFIDNVLGSRPDPGTRAKYKSTYLKKNFSEHETKTFWKYFTQDLPGLDSSGCMILIDSYGGAVNNARKSRENSIFQRKSIMKHQFLSYWQDKAQDDAKIGFMNTLYTELYTSNEVPAGKQGTPYPGEKYEGCYINYPDKDMLKYDFWPELYWGTNYKFLQETKRKYDTNNIFHHSMSIRS